MPINELVNAYFDAWNQRDVDGLLSLLHPGAAYYDAFWMETCVGRNLAEYLGDTMDEMPHWYRPVGAPMETEHGVVSRYSAHDSPDARSSKPLYSGADILVLLDGKILTVTDLYCDPHQDALREVSSVAATRHGVPSHTRSGLGSLRTMRIRSRLLICLDEEKTWLKYDLTPAELAARVGCSTDQLSLVIFEELGTSLAKLLAEGREQRGVIPVADDSDTPSRH